MKRLRDEVLSSAMNECIDSDEYWYGESYIRKVYNVMTSIKSLNKEFDIGFERSYSNYKNANYDYICHMIFYNNLGVELLDLKFTERFAFNLVSILYRFAISDNLDLGMAIDTVDSDLSDYLLAINRHPTEDKMTMSIYKYSRSADMMNCIITLTLTSDILEDMIYMMYFSYLIDLDDGENYVTYFEKNKYVDCN